MRRRAEIVAKDCVLAMRAGLRMTAVAAVKEAGKCESPVPAACRLEEVPTDGAHRAKLRRGRLRARLPQYLWNLRICLELRERCPRADPRSLDAARDGVGEVHERVGARQAVAQQRHQL